MPARVFISCGQANDEERATAANIASELQANGFETYVAIQAQSIEDVNSGIISSLKRSDYYLFIDFKRDEMEKVARGSLFTNQELAIAYVLGFERVLFFQQAGVRLEGLLGYMGSNPTKFQQSSELPSLVIAAINARHWQPDYSRHLVVGPLRWSDTLIKYDDLFGRFLYIDIQNLRQDLAAYDTVPCNCDQRFSMSRTQPFEGNWSARLRPDHLAAKPRCTRSAGSRHSSER